MLSASALDIDVEAFLVEVDRQLRPYLERAVARVADVAPLKPGVTHQLSGGGKRIRAALCVASCELFGTPLSHGLDFAAAIEHIHNFTLVHDDIADGDTHRRAQPSMWKQYGIAHAINIGDVFVPLAAEAILNADYPDALKLRLLALTTEQALHMVEGQNLDLNLHRKNSVADGSISSARARRRAPFSPWRRLVADSSGGAGA